MIFGWPAAAAATPKIRRNLRKLPHASRPRLRFRLLADPPYIARRPSPPAGAQKSGMVWAHDPDKKGAVLWKTQVVDTLGLGMITFGGAADDQKAYFGLRTGGMAADAT